MVTQTMPQECAGVVNGNFVRVQGEINLKL